MGKKDNLGKNSIIQHCIQTGQTLSIEQAPRMLPLDKKETSAAEVKSMIKTYVKLTMGFSHRFCGAICKSVRFRINYRKWNAFTVKDSYS